jgi:hypothetical protein
MMLKSVVLAAMLALPVYFPERETVAERDAFLAELAAFVIAIGWHETKFSPRLGRSECKPWECDPRRFTLPDGRKVVQHRARGTFQVWRTRAMSNEEWDALKGPDSYDAQVKEAVKRSRSALSACRGQTDALAKSFGHYGTGKGCVISRTARERVETMARVRSKL